MNDLRKTIIIQKTIIVLTLVAQVIITLCCYKQELKIVSLVKENESLKGRIEMQQSVIANLEENLRNKREEKDNV